MQDLLPYMRNTELILLGICNAAMTFKKAHFEVHTCHGHVFLGFARPLLTALLGDLNFPWEWALGARKQQVKVTAGDTTYLSVSARAVIFTVGLEGLTAPVNNTIKHTIVSFNV